MYDVQVVVWQLFITFATIWDGNKDRMKNRKRIYLYIGIAVIAAILRR
jgi:hypothetical protein